MDIKKIVENLLKEIQKDGDLKAQFEKNPVKVIERVAGVDLPDDIVNKVIDSVMKNIDKDGDFDLSDIADMAKNIDIGDVADMAKNIDVKDAVDVLKKLF